MPKFEYWISSVRFDNEQYENMICQTLIAVAHSKKKACNIMERLMTEAGFKHVKEQMKDLRGPEGKHVIRYCSAIRNFNDRSSLGPGGYLLEKKEAGAFSTPLFSRK